MNHTYSNNSTLYLYPLLVILLLTLNYHACKLACSQLYNLFICYSLISVSDIDDGKIKVFENLNETINEIMIVDAYCRGVSH